MMRTAPRGSEAVSPVIKEIPGKIDRLASWDTANDDFNKTFKCQPLKSVKDIFSYFILVLSATCFFFFLKHLKFGLYSRSS